MIISTREVSFSIVLLTLTLGGCAITGPLSQTVQENSPALGSDVSYEIKLGDRLSDIALTLTGDAANGQIIAERNGISDPDSISQGQTILIPSELLRQTYSRRDEQTTVFNTNSALASANSGPLPVTTGNGLSVARGRDVAAIAPDTEDSAAINISSVEVNRSFDLQPLDEPLFSMNDSSDLPEGLEIRIAGSYYPKGIYDEPANYARLVQRADPGTLFQLEGKVNDWYKIVTDKGFGYLRQSDGVIVQ